MNSRGKNGNGGYLAIITSIIISFLLLTISINQNQSGWSLNDAIANAESKEYSLYSAKDCTKYAIEKIITDNNYLGNSTTTTPNGFCYILPIQKNLPTSREITLKVTSSYKKSYTNLETVVYMNDINFNSIPLSATPQNPPNRNLKYEIVYSREVSLHN